MASSDTIPSRFLATVAAHGDVIALADPFDETRQWTYDGWPTTSPAPPPDWPSSASSGAAASCS